MRVILFNIIYIIVIMGVARAQNELNYGQFDTRVTDKSILDNRDLKWNF